MEYEIGFLGYIAPAGCQKAVLVPINVLKLQIRAFKIKILKLTIASSYNMLHSGLFLALKGSNFILLIIKP